MADVQQTKLIEQFQCLGDACEDTCCQNWSMQVDDATIARYREQAPELLEAVEEDNGLMVMRRNPATRHCIKMEDGWCSIHKKFGSEMLGDACHFYPRVTRMCGGKTLMTATPSCPEVVRLLLAMEDPFTPVTHTIERVPHQMKQYLPEGVDEAVAIAVHEAMLETAMDQTIAPEQALARLSSVARSLPMLDKKTLDQSVPVYLRLADGRLPAPESHPADHFNLLHALCGLIVASQKPVSPRLQQTISDMETALKVTLDWQNTLIQLSEKSEGAVQKIWDDWRESSGHYDHALRRFLALQCSLHFFPFAGLGNMAQEKITFIGVRFSIIKLALACAHHLHGALPEEEVVRIIQSLSRFLDHLGDATFSLAIFNETGWIKEARLRALFA